MGSRKPSTPGLFDLEQESVPQAPARHLGRFVRVALNRPVRREFSYLLPEGLAPGTRVGMRVAVPLGTRRLVGVVVAIEDESEIPPARLKRVLAVLDEEPVVGAELLGLTRWIAERYACSLGEALAAVLPAPLKRERARRKVPRISLCPGVGAEELESLRERHPEQHRLLRTLMELGEPALLRDLLRGLRLSESPARTLRKRGWVELDYVEERPDPLSSASSARARPGQLSGGQSDALQAVEAALDSGESRTFLLFGVTGSGKTEVYLRAIESALARGRGAIVLVPEIALTPQTTGWFRSRFGEVCVLHSRMSDARRLDEWRRLQRSEVRVVVGARSALFAPVKDLGVIVVDEEHEPSFKQESVPRYHAREVAVERARRAGGVCLLGSATPSLEAWHRARTGEYGLLRLPQRVGGGSSSSVQVVDMRIESERASERQAPRGGGGALFSRLLLTFLEETLEAGEQAILFLNRRGFVPVLWCPGCQTTLSCGHCSMALTYHRRIQRLVCHACCREQDVPAACPACSRPRLRPLGVGSERVESDLSRAFPAARVRRMDSDTMRRPEDYERTLAAFERRELDVLVGTQMIAKGLDFPCVTLVGILAADQALHLPDVRASERAFQLIAQVSGRAGRSSLPGRVVVQTSMPDHPAVRLGARSDYEGFAAIEEEQRRAGGYPPFGRLLRALFEDEDEPRVRSAVARAVTELRQHLGVDERVVLGPAPAPFALLRGRHRHHLMVRTPPESPLHERAREWLVEQSVRETRPSLKIDVDPMSLL